MFSGDNLDKDNNMEQKQTSLHDARTFLSTGQYPPVLDKKQKKALWKYAKKLQLEAGQCTQKALRSWEEEDECSGKAEMELFSGARSPRFQGGSSSKAPLCRDRTALAFWEEFPVLFCFVLFGLAAG
ncbi:UNVERIFIED_CONTAM: hypothetical protein FKN15_060842 [Acipenser sinensis]